MGLETAGGWRCWWEVMWQCCSSLWQSAEPITGSRWIPRASSQQPYPSSWVRWAASNLHKSVFAAILRCCLEMHDVICWVNSPVACQSMEGPSPADYPPPPPNPGAKKKLLLQVIEKRGKRTERENRKKERHSRIAAPPRRDVFLTSPVVWSGAKCKSTAFIPDAAHPP